MKQKNFFTSIIAMSVLLSTNALAQKTENPDSKKPQEKKTKEIVIRQKGDKADKMTIVVDGDKVTVNGKPLSDFHDGDVKIIDRDLAWSDSHDFAFSPRGRDMQVHVFADDSNAKPRTFLGVITEKATNGVSITSVIRGSAAEKAGLQKGDIITELNDKKITSPEVLMDVVQSYKPNDNVKIKYVRNNSKKETKLNLGETKERSRTYSFSGDYPEMNGDNFNFAMPPMPRMPRTFYNYKFRYNNTPKLGLKIEDMENTSGAKILNVDEGSAADKAGLKKDDIITEINGEKVNNVDEIRDQLNETADKESFNLKAKRNNAEMNFEIKIPKKLNTADL